MTLAVFFDVANTLLHKPALYPAMTSALEAHGIRIPVVELARRHRWLSEIVEFPDTTSAGFYRDFNARLLRGFGVVPTTGVLDDVFAACSYLAWQPFDDVDALRGLGHPLGTLSNWDGSLTEKLTLVPEVTFDWVLGSHNEGVRKPDPAFFERASAASGVPAAEIAFVGDSLRLDIEPALALGMRAWLIDRDNLYPHATVPRITSMTELAGLL